MTDYNKFKFTRLKRPDVVAVKGRRDIIACGPEKPPKDFVDGGVMDRTFRDVGEDFRVLLKQPNFSSTKTVFPQNKFRGNPIAPRCRARDDWQKGKREFFIMGVRP